MNVLSLFMNNFTKHATTDLRFPPVGVVLVTGPNGSGKSSLVEGVSWGGWGETLRGTVPGGRDKKACATSLITQMHTNDAEEAAHRLAGKFAKQIEVNRQRKSDRSEVSWSKDGTPQREFPTTSKAQEALEGYIGTHEVWRRTHVFSSGDAAHFTDATDKERKLFLEAWLGLGRFDEALGACRLALTLAQQRFDASQGRAQMLRAELDGLNHRVADAKKTLESLPADPPPGGHETTLANLRHSIKSTETSLRELRRDLAEQQQAAGSHWGEVKQLEARARRLAKPGDTCGECGQPLPVDKEALEKLGAAVQSAKKTAEGAQARIASEVGGIEEQIKDDERTLARLREKEAAASREAGAQEATRRTRRAAAEALASAEAGLAKAGAAAELVLAELPGLEREVKVLRAAESVLGLRGVRAGLLARLLGGLESAANAWLPKVAGKGLRLELKSYSEKKSGGVSDSIGLTVHGAGGGEGYKAASQGERRRIDVALLLAFAGRGTLFFDEVFDALDTDGIQAIVDVLDELTKDRCAVVITHSEELAARIPHVAHWKVADGAVAA